MAVGYVTLPLAVGALVSDVAPDHLRKFLLEHIKSVVIVVVGAALTPIAYWMGHWRARQIEWALALIRLGVVTPVPRSEHGKRRA